jgi:type I restriction enzyme S subunit
MTKERTELVRKPASWCEAEVKDVLRIIDYRGRTPPYSFDGIPHLRSSNIRDGKIIWEGLKYVSQEIYDLYMTRGLPEKDDVLFTTEAPLGEVALAPNQKFSLAQRMMILKPPRNVILPKFLMYQIQSGNFQRKIGNVGTGTTVSGISSRNFKPIPLLIAPFAEQQRIVDKIEELFSDLDSGIASLKTARQQLKVYRQAVLKWAFEGKLTAQWREEQQRQGKLESADTLLAQITAEREQRYQKELEVWQAEVEAWDAIGKEGKKPSKPKKPKELLPLDVSETETLKVLPELWQWVNFGELIQWGPQNGLYKSSNYYGKGTLIVRIDNFYDGKLNSYKTFKRLSVEESELKLYQLKVNEILINRVNSMTYIGKCALVSSTPEDCVFESNIMRLKIFHDFISPKFITYYLSSPTGLKQLRKNVKQAVNQASINQTDVALSQVPLCSLAEQSQIIEEIESRLSICDQLEADIETNLKKTEALRQSILKQAFEGKLVPQDPNDEPASVLLERIYAERQTKEKVNSTKTKAPKWNGQL